MQRDQFVRLTSDAFTIRLSKPPPLKHRPTLRLRAGPLLNT
jgi:hypothetical protein